MDETTFESASTSWSILSAASHGSLTPCSQLWIVLVETFRVAANTAWDIFSFLRIEAILAGPILGGGAGNVVVFRLIWPFEKAKLSSRPARSCSNRLMFWHRLPRDPDFA